MVVGNPALPAGLWFFSGLGSEDLSRDLRTGIDAQEANAISESGNGIRRLSVATPNPMKRQRPHRISAVSKRKWLPSTYPSAECPDQWIPALGRASGFCLGNGKGPKRLPAPIVAPAWPPRPPTPAATSGLPGAWPSSNGAFDAAEAARSLLKAGRSNSAGIGVSAPLPARWLLQRLSRSPRKGLPNRCQGLLPEVIATPARKPAGGARRAPDLRACRRSRRCGPRLGRPRWSSRTPAPAVAPNPRPPQAASASSD